jgi:hypothetical protein
LKVWRISAVFLLLSVSLLTNYVAKAEENPPATESVISPVKIATEGFVRSGLETRPKKTELSPVAFSGEYNDLSNKPTSLDGKSAYEIAREQGGADFPYESEAEWLESLKGMAGASAYELAVKNGFKGTEEEWVASLKGAAGDPASLTLGDAAGAGNAITALTYEDGTLTPQKGATFYSKPDTGVPKSDLDSSVQSSLAKADAAVQPSVLDTAVATHNALETAHAEKFADYRTSVAQDEIDAGKLDASGGTMTGALVIPAKNGAPSDDGTAVASERQVYDLAAKKATATDLGMVKIGNGLAIDSNGLLTNTGIKTVYDWSTSIPVLGEVWGTVTIPSNSLTPAPNVPISYPQIGDKVYGANSTQVLVTDLHVQASGGDSVRGTIVVGPPSSANWGTITGAMPNNAAVPALTKNGGTNVSLIKIDAADKIQVGHVMYPANVNSDGRMTNNGVEIALKSDVDKTAQDLSDEITNRGAADGILQQNIEAETTRAGVAEQSLQGRIDALIDDTKTDSYSTTLSAHAILGHITQAYTPIPDVATPADLPSESELTSPSICFVNSTGTSWINTKTGNGWKNSGGNYASMGDVQQYLADNSYLKSSNVVNNLTTADTGAPLSAAQGKYLMETKLTATQTVDNLTSASTTNPLSANMGKTLNTKISALESKFTGEKANAAVVADTSSASAKLSTPRTIQVNLSGYASGSGSVSFDGANNAAINIATQGASSGGFVAEGSVGIPNYGSSNGWVYLGQFSAGYNFTFKISCTFGMMGADYTVLFGNRSGNEGNWPATLINNQLRSYASGSYVSGVRVYSQGVYPVSTYKVFLYVPSYSGGSCTYKVSAENGVSLPTWAPSGFKVLDMTNTSDDMFPPNTDFPKYWSWGGNNTNVLTYGLGYQNNGTFGSYSNWWVANPK